MATSVQTPSALRWTLIVITAVGLLVDAVVHFHLAGSYANVRSNLVSEGTLFRIEATVAALVAIALLIRPRRYTAAVAFIVAAGGTLAVVVTGFVNVGAVGPLPDMYDPTWYAEKTLSAVAEGIAAVSAFLLFIQLHAEARRADRAPVRVDGATA